MKRDVSIDKKGAISAAVRVIDHPAVTWIDVWLDEDGNGRPDKYSSRVKNPNERENEVVDIGQPGALVGKVLQWAWMPSQPPTSVDNWIVEFHVLQDGKLLPGFPVKLTGAYPTGQKYGLFETWIRFTESA